MKANELNQSLILTDYYLTKKLGQSSINLRFVLKSLMFSIRLSTVRYTYAGILLALMIVKRLAMVSAAHVALSFALAGVLGWQPKQSSSDSSFV